MTSQPDHELFEPASLDDLLAAYAAGATSPGLSLLCAAHLTLRPEAREYVDMLEEIGGRLLSADAVAETGRNGGPAGGRMTAELQDLRMDVDALFARLDEPTPTRAAARAPQPASGGPLPRAVLQAANAISFDAIPWRKRLGGVSDYVLDGFDGENVSLLRARPGATIPKHTHDGLEATLVLAGTLRDGGVDYHAGDIALAGPEDDHIPEIVGDDLCYCLVVIDGGLRFTGAFGRALNLLAE